MVQSRREFVKSTGLVGMGALAGVPSGVRSRALTRDRQEVRMVQTPVLNIACEDSGDSAGFPIILLHGFPYDVRAWDGVVPPLVTPDTVCSFRTCGLRAHAVPRSLRAARSTASRYRPGCDRPCRRAGIGPVRNRRLRLGKPRRVHHIDPSTRTGARPGCRRRVFSAEHRDCVAPCLGRKRARLWYQWYFNTDRGRAGLEANRRGICRYLWETWSPGWQFSDEMFERSAVSFDSPEFVDVVIHSYRHRHRNAPGEERFIGVEKLLAEQPRIQVPAIVLRGAARGIGRTVPDPSADRARFTSLVARRIIDGAGHDLPAQTPDAVSSALLELLA